MQSRWSDEEARAFVETWAAAGQDLALRVYTSRLLGAEHDLVMHGGGNTSVKITRPDVLGEPVEAICVKGSGWDLDTIEPRGLPAMRLDSLRRLRALDSLSDEEMVNQQRTCLFDSTSPNPSVETLLHAFLPHRFIDHTHADAVLALTNQPDGERLVREVLGDDVVIVPYVMPGFALAKLAAELWGRQPRARGMVLLKHGLFSFGDDARTSYERTIEMVDAAERFVASRTKGRVAEPPQGADAEAAVAEAGRRAARIAPVLRGLLARPTGDMDRPWRRVVLEHRATPEVLALLAEPGCESLSRRGPLTPDHVIRTKAEPLFVRVDAGDPAGDARAALASAIEDFRRRYDAYFDAQVAAKGVSRTRLDPDPRVILVPGVGLFAAGKSRKDAA
ncbi:MAG: class II aldolase/adducin family protein, partial [Alphaproteobacteria bacterium]